MNPDNKKRWIAGVALFVVVGIVIALLVYYGSGGPSGESVWYVTIEMDGENEPIIVPADMAAGPNGMEDQKEELRAHLAKLIDNAATPSAQAARLCKISVSKTEDGVRKKFPFVLLINTPQAAHPYTLAQEKSDGGELQKAADFNKADDLKRHSVEVVFLTLRNAESVRRRDERK